ncbi:MAG: phosphate ABC transporter substrate-binding protein [Clostridiales bacterium]|nr:phosphate ABC transporter substrate-binding protein [Clostridiales bacterium]
MKSSTKKMGIIISSAIMSLSLMLTGCGDAASTSPAAAGSASSGLSGSVLVTGSTSVQPLAQDLSDTFLDVESGITVEVQGGGSTQGIKDVSEGVSDIGTSSRELKEEEKSLGLTEHIIAYDGIAVVVNPANTITNLTKDQITAIFKGDIKNWKEVGGADQEILVVTREDGSGTRGAFEELLKLQEKKDGKTYSLMATDALVADGNGAVKANIASKENAIGYTSLGFVDDTLKMLTVDSIECSTATVKSGEYAISRPFLMLTKGDMKPEVKAFMDYVLSDAGQALVAEKYITVK